MYSGSSDGMPDIPTGTGTGTGDLDEVFNKSLGDFDGDIGAERDGIASSGGGSAKAAGQKEEGDAAAVAGGTGAVGMGDAESASGAGGMADTGAGGMTGGGPMSGSDGGMAGQESGSQDGGAGGMGGEGMGAGENSSGGEGEEDAGREEQQVAKLPDDIPVDGSGDDVVGRQIREAAISMQETNPAAAEKLWDEYRKHTGIK